MRKTVAMVLVVGMLSQTTGCFGGFHLTRNIWGWNNTVTGSKFVNWLVFLGLTVIPVYAIGGLADLFIFNSLEFWTGSNPMASNAQPSEKTVALEDGTTWQFKRVSETQMQVVIDTQGETKTIIMDVDQDGMKWSDGEGQLIATIEDFKDGVVVRTTHGADTVYTAEDVRALESRMGSGEPSMVAAEFVREHNSDVAAR